jgi:hypothetical protein
MKKRLVTIWVMVAMLVLVPYSTAFADKPVVEPFQLEIADQIDCGDFIVVQNAVVDATFTTFFDNHGNPVRLQVHVHYDGTLTNPESGASLLDRNTYMRIYDYEDDTHTFVGVIYKITIPGQGIVVQDMGRIVWTAFPGTPGATVIWQAGPHIWPDSAEELICAALE